MSDKEKNAAPSIKEAFENKKTPVEDNVGEQDYFRLSGNDYDKKKLTAIIKRLEKIPQGKVLLEQAKKEDYELDFASGMQSYGGMSPDKKKMSLNSSMSDEKLVSTLAHECRHCGQFGGDIDLNERKDTIKTYLMGKLAIEADANANAALVSWQAKEMGDSSVWDRFKDDYPYIAEPFEKAAEKGGVKTGEAQSEAFKGWYSSVYVRSRYEMAYVRFLRDISWKDHKSEQSLSNVRTAEETVNQVCKTEDGGCYFKGDPKILEDKDHISVGHENWWSYWRFVRDKYGFINGGDEKANEAMKDIPKRDVTECYELIIDKDKVLAEKQSNAAKKIAKLRESKKVPAKNDILLSSRKKRKGR